MSEQKTEATPATKPATKPAAKPEGDAGKVKPAASASPIPMIGAAAAALVLGSVLGIFVVAPHIVTARTGAQVAASGGERGKKSEKGAKGEKGEKGKDDKPSETVVHKIENLIVNPAGSGGRRFLMMSVAIEVPDARTEQILRAQDPMLRDAIIGAVQGTSFDVITSRGGRDSVRVAIARVVQPLLPDAEYFHIYLPQFVLQ